MGKHRGDKYNTDQNFNQYYDNKIQIVSSNALLCTACSKLYYELGQVGQKQISQILQIIFSLAPIAACSKQWASKEVTPQAARLLAALKLEQIHNPCFAQIQIHK